MEYLSVPYIGPMPSLRDGTMVTIQGTVPSRCNRFHINLSVSPELNEKCDIALHMNPRFESCNQVVRNHFSRGRWGNEERNGPGFPLRKGERFECIILCTNQHYKIAFNGQHFCEFQHRLPKERVTSLVIEGDVTLQGIRFQGPGTETLPQPGPAYDGPPRPCVCPPGPGFAPAAPPFMAPGAFAPPAPFSPHGPPRAGPLPPPVNLSVPLKHPVAGGLYPERLIYISGVPHSTGAKKFTINLKVSDGPNADIAFHFDVRFNERAIVRNTFRRKWEREERNAPNFPFAPGVNFDIIIKCEANSLKVAVNNTHFIEYKHRIRDLNSIRWLEVFGDLRLTNVHVP